jgi:hypothetical protein
MRRQLTMQSNETVLLGINESDRVISKGMEKTDLDNQVQQCVGSYKPARIPLVQVYELNKKMTVLNS